MIIIFNEDDPDPDIHVRLLAWRNKFEKRKALKKDISEELISLAWQHPKWWWRLSEDEKKEIEPIFTDKVGKRWKCF